MRTYAMRWIVGLSLAMIGAACGPDPAPQDNNGDNNVGGNACERVEALGIGSLMDVATLVEQAQEIGGVVAHDEARASR